MTRRNHFQLFGVDADTGPDHLRAVYHSLAKQWHADAYAGVHLDPATQKKLDDVFQHINDAYDTLTNQKRRSEYLVYVDRMQKGMSVDVHGVLRAEGLFDDALAAIRRRDWKGAEPLIREAIELNPDDQLYRATLGWVVFNRGKSDESKVREAVQILRDAIKKQAALPSGYNYLGQIYFAREQYAEAMKWWRQCLEYDPKNVDAARGMRLASSRKEKGQSNLPGWLAKLLGK